MSAHSIALRAAGATAAAAILLLTGPAPGAQAAASAPANANTAAEPSGGDPNDPAGPPETADQAGVRPTPPVPAGFDWRNATDDVLQSYGLPPRPDSPTAYAAWAQALTAAKSEITSPTYRQGSQQRHPQPARNADKGTVSCKPNGSTAGAICEGDYGAGYGTPAYSGYVSSATAEWNLPQPLSQNQIAPTSMAIWPGIGYNGEGDLWQAGTDSYRSGGLLNMYYAWFEDYPKNYVTVNLPLNPGDLIYSNVSMISPTVGTFTLENLTTGSYMAKQVTLGAAVGNEGGVFVEHDFGSAPPDFNQFTILNASLKRGSTTTCVGALPKVTLYLTAPATYEPWVTPGAPYANGCDWTITRNNPI